MGIEAQEQVEYSKKLQGYDDQHGHSHSHTLKHKLNPLVLNSNTTKSQLAASHSLLSELHHRLNSTNLLIQALLIDLTTRQQEKQYSRNNTGKRSSNEELNLAFIHSPIGALCLRFQDELNQYMSYDIEGECLGVSHSLKEGAIPSLQKILLSQIKICKIAFEKYHQIATLFGILILVRATSASLRGRTIKDTVKIALICKKGKRVGTFAARMKERNVTIITSTLDLDGPFSHFIASRRLIPIHLSISQRLLFFENTLDIVHFMEFIGNWLPETMLEFLLYDVYRVLRPGGIFWLEHFFCFGSQVNKTYLPMFDRVGFNRLRWHAGRKLDHDGIQKNEWYISALLEKPVI
ncbi:uncharacterized protein DS421_4g112690 [Arachis hypogaea]|nr:uncharacterized protein DS421_4g112690 [Arachis hypogaea]